MTWRRDTRPENVRSIGDYAIYSEVNRDRETAHVVAFPDGSEYRVLPDGRSGQKRSNLVRQAVGVLDGASDALRGNMGYLVLAGQLSEMGLEWEEVSDESDVCESCGRPL